MITEKEHHRVCLCVFHMVHFWSILVILCAFEHHILVSCTCTLFLFFVFLRNVKMSLLALQYKTQYAEIPNPIPGHSQVFECIQNLYNIIIS